MRIKETFIFLFCFILLSYSCKKDSIQNEYRNKIPSNGLVLYYSFDGNLLDKTSNNNNGNKFGISSFSTSLYNKALLFYGDSLGYIKPTVNPKIDTTSFTISCFVKSSSLLDQQCILQRGCAETGSILYGYCLSIGSNAIVFWLGHGTYLADAHVTTFKINDNHWHHIGIVWSKPKQRVKMYVDGILLYTNQSEDLPILFHPNYDNGFTIGRRIAGIHNFAQFDGSIDQLRIYNRDLSDEEIKYLIYE